MKIINGVCPGAELFEHCYVLTRTPHCVDWNLKLDLTRKKIGKFRKEIDVYGGTNG